MKLTKGQIQSWADFQPRPIREPRIKGINPIPWILAVVAIGLLALSVYQTI